MNKLTVEEAQEIAKNKDEIRFSHVFGTFKKASYLAKKYQVDLYKCQIASLLHDYAKNESDEFLVEIIKNHLDMDYLQYPSRIYHGIVGAYLIEKNLNVKDPQIIDAIRHHVTGHPHMNDIGKVVFVSDFIEETRQHEAVNFCRYLSEISLDLAVLGCCETTYYYLKRFSNKNIHPLTIQTYKYFLDKVGVDFYESIKNNYKSM